MGERHVLYKVGTTSETPIAWQPDRCPNPHLCISGATGTGKTYTIRQIIEAFSASGISFTVIDIHGDLGVIDSIVREYRLGYGSASGVNPLTVNPDARYAGPKSNASNFIELLNELAGTHKMGPVQVNMLFNVIMDLYGANKIRQDDPPSWAQHTYPDLKDLERFIGYKYKKLMIGGSNGAADHEIDKLQALYRKKKALEKLEKSPSPDAEARIAETISSLVRLYEEYLRKGILHDPDFLTYSDPKGLVGLRNRIQNLNNTDVFVKNETPLTNVRLNMKYLEDEQRKLAAYYTIKRLLDRFTRAGERGHVRHYIVIDECSFFLEVPRIEHMIVRTVQEGRKFGLGLILATQNPLKFNNDILLNTATKMVFAVEPVVHRAVAKTFGIDEGRLRKVEPRKDCMFSTRPLNRGEFYLVRRY